MKKSIELKGVHYPVSLNMLELEEFLEEEGTTLADVSEYLGGGSIRKMFKLLHYMMRAGAARIDEKIDISVMQLADIIGFEIDKVTEVITSAMPEPDAEMKKKTRGRPPAKVNGPGRGRPKNAKVKR